MISEMASSLTKLGVPKKLMQAIHQLEGKKVRFGYRADKQYDLETGEELSGFRTALQDVKYREQNKNLPAGRKMKTQAGGDFPTRQDYRMSHDVEVVGQPKRGRNKIYHYLTQELDPKKDMDVKLLLYCPESPADDEGNVKRDTWFYINKKTGKLTDDEKKQFLRDLDKNDPDYLRERGVYINSNLFNDPFAMREAWRRLEISNKRGLYLRGAMIDPRTDTPVILWLGTIGQLMDTYILKNKDITSPDQEPVLYIMQEETRAHVAKETRKASKIYTNEQFLDYFITHYSKLADKFFSSGKKEKEDEIAMLLGTITRENREEVNNRIAEIEDELNEHPSITKEQLSTKLNGFLKYLKDDEMAEYKDSESRYGQADLTDVINKHKDDINTVASMFLQFIIMGKVITPVYTTNYIKKLGLEQLFDF